MRLILTLVILQLNLICGYSQSCFNAADTSYLQIEIKGLRKSALLSIQQWNSLPFNSDKLDLLVKKDTTLTFHFLLYHATKFEIGLNFENIATVLILQKDTLKVCIAVDSINNSNVNFLGETSNASDYLSFSKYSFFSPPKKGQTLCSYNMQIDSLANICYDSLNCFNKRKPLPIWFLRLEKENIRLLCMFWKVEQFRLHFVYNKNRIARPYNFIDSLGFDINDTTGVLTDHYTDISWTYLSSIQYDTLLTFIDDKKILDYRFEFKKEILLNAKKIKNPKIRDCIYLSAVSNELTNKFFGPMIEYSDSLYLKRVFSLYDLVKDDFSTAIALNVLRDIKVKQLSQTKINNPNTKYFSQKFEGILPDIYLNEISGDSIRLSKFVGKRLFINFWATWCGGCIASIPAKNQLIEEYSSDKFVFLNICMDGGLEKWNKIVDTKKLKGENLYCPKLYSRAIIDHFKIKGYPKYCLIDETGKYIIDDTYDLTIIEAEIKKMPVPNKRYKTDGAQ